MQRDIRKILTFVFDFKLITAKIMENNTEALVISKRLKLP